MKKYRIVKDAFGRHQAQMKKYFDYEDIGIPDYSFEKVEDFVERVEENESKNNK